MKFLWLMAAALAAFFMVAPAWAQGCQKRPTVLDHLYQNYSETVRVMGLSYAGYVVELLVSRSGTWTLISTSPTGCTKMVGSGTNLEILPMPVEGNKT